MNATMSALQRDKPKTFKIHFPIHVLSSVAAAVQGKSKFRGLDCNRGTKAAMKR